MTTMIIELKLKDSTGCNRVKKIKSDDSFIITKDMNRLIEIRRGSDLLFLINPSELIYIEIEED